MVIDKGIFTLCGLSEDDIVPLTPTQAAAITQNGSINDIADCIAKTSDIRQSSRIALLMDGQKVYLTTYGEAAYHIANVPVPNTPNMLLAEIEGALGLPPLHPVAASIIRSMTPGPELVTMQQFANIQDAANQFTLAIMSDPQFNWSCADDGETTSDYCQQGANLTKSRAQQGWDTNALQLISISALAQSTKSAFRGLIVNGDLTRYGKTTELDRFNQFYSSFPGYRWPGLGNHDTHLDCNVCMADMVSYMKLGILGHFWPTVNWAIISGGAGWGGNTEGSLAYSWNIGPFHFVQMHFYPGYKKAFENGTGNKTKIIDSYKWLAKDLSLYPDRNIVLNWHDMLIYTPSSTGNADPFNNYNDADFKKLETALAPYAKQIKAIFVGHVHSYFGHVSSLDIKDSSGNPVSIPVIYSGSSIYNRYIRADFSFSSSTCTIATQVISSSTGAVTNTTASNGSSGADSIPCNPIP